MQKLVCMILDGIGWRKDSFGNAFMHANTPFLDQLRLNSIFTTIQAHGISVGMPAEQDLGNSEVGHNTIGSGRIIAQGASLVKTALSSGGAFHSPVWHKLTACGRNHTLHFIGLLSDGNVHSHEDHLHALLRAAKKDAVRRVRIHILLDGRDVAEKSAEIYISRLKNVMTELCDQSFDVAIASGGGRMRTTMDRYEADWSIVQRGWDAHVEGIGEHVFSDIDEAMQTLRQKYSCGDQELPSFVIADHGEPVGRIHNGDGVLFFNFRGDRAIELSRAFDEPDLKHITKRRSLDVSFAGMTQYDGDLAIPKNYLVAPPVIQDTLSEYLCSLGVRQFACSETQKFGHVTYFWNGNRSGYIQKDLEKYLEIPSDRITFDKKPEMKAQEITDALCQALKDSEFDFYRVNLANGDMVGHTGDFQAAIKAVEVVDKACEQVASLCKQLGISLLITADHGNCEEMFAGSEQGFPDWHTNPPPKKTSHTLSPVPVYIIDSSTRFELNTSCPSPGLANLANTFLDLMDLPQKPNYNSSLLRLK
jgi:2,3-bisphosphoglycerate-independent phosphoglycerate mutase